ncbi:transport and Golgi organization protein 6 homolog [Glandiceps talaboti]
MTCLISPVTTEGSHEGPGLPNQLKSKIAGIDAKLQHQFSELFRELQVNYEWKELESCKEVTWKYTQYCTSMLKFVVSEYMKEDAKSAGSVLSVNHQKTLESTIQFVVYLGIYPNLLPGVGIQLTRRSQFASLIENRTKFAFDCDYQLLHCVKTLLCCCQNQYIKTLVLTKHLNDLFASLLQICHAPKKKNITVPSSSMTEMVNRSDETIQQSSVRLLTENELRYSQEELHKLLDRVYLPSIVQELLVLQGGPAHKTPRWLKRVCGDLLSDILLKANGVKAVVKGFLHTMSGTTNVTDWQKCEVIGRLIATCPKKMNSVEEYYKHIAKQVLELFHDSDDLMKSSMNRIGAACITTMYTKHAELTQQYLIHPLQEPLSRCFQTRSDTGSSTPCTVVGEQELSQCIQDIYQLYIYNGDGITTLRCTLKPILKLVFQLYCYTKQGVSHLRSSLEEILGLYFKSCEKSDCMEQLLYLALPHEDRTVLSEPMATIQFTSGSDGGVVIVTADAAQLDDSEIKIEHTMQCVVHLLEIVNNDTVIAEFFIHVLKELTDVLSKDGVCAKPASSEGNASQTLLGIEKTMDEMSRHYAHAINVLYLISTLCEQQPMAILQQTYYILQFIHTTLDRMCEICEKSENNLDMLVVDTLTMTLGMLAIIYQPTTKFETDEKVQLQKMVPVLLRLSKCCPNPFIQQMASDLHIAIATHGAVTMDTNPVNPPNKTKQPERKKESEKRTDRKTSEKKPKTYTSGRDDRKAHDGYVDFEFICEELCDPSIPVQAHAVRRLTQLLENRDMKTLENKDKVFAILKEKLESDDSFLYLSAIQGIVALADISPQTVLPLLCQLFTARTGPPESEDVAMRMKVGEALVRACTVMGDMLPAYVQPVINTLLLGAKDTDAIMRASSLSNLAQVCHVIKAAIIPVIQEVVVCVRDIVKTDSESEVRRAAVHVIRQLLTGLQQDSIQV